MTEPRHAGYFPLMFKKLRLAGMALAAVCVTPAMAAGVTERLRELEDIVCLEESE